MVYAMGSERTFKSSKPIKKTRVQSNTSKEINSYLKNHSISVQTDPSGKVCIKSVKKQDIDKMFESDINIVLLDASIQKLASAFYSENSAIDRFLRSPEAMDDGFGKTYVWLEDDNTKIIGFYNIGTGSIDWIDGDDRYKMGGSIHINEFALDKKYKGVTIPERNYHMSDILLSDCIQRILYMRENYVGFAFITLQSTKEGYKLYSRHDFLDIEEDMNLSNMQDKDKKCKPMYLPLDLEQESPHIILLEIENSLPIVYIDYAWMA